MAPANLHWLIVWYGIGAALGRSSHLPGPIGAENVVMTTAEVLGGALPSQPDSAGFRRQLLPVRPPELPHRTEDLTR